MENVGSCFISTGRILKILTSSIHIYSFCSVIFLCGDKCDLLLF